MKKLGRPTIYLALGRPLSSLSLLSLTFASCAAAAAAMMDFNLAKIGQAFCSVV